MRVISGRLRGKRLTSLEGENTRPTLDRIKEAVFNIIQFRMQDSKILDLFAGSGGLGIEALSRGANEAIFSDNSIEAIKIINKNIEDTKLANQATVINKDYLLTLRKLKQEDYRFDIIFIDPPYKSDFAIKSVLEITRLDLLEEDGIIIVETDNGEVQEQVLKIRNIKVQDIRKYGRVLVIFIGRS